MAETWDFVTERLIAGVGAEYLPTHVQPQGRRDARPARRELPVRGGSRGRPEGLAVKHVDPISGFDLR
jgi:hypothetical protein